MKTFKRVLYADVIVQAIFLVTMLVAGIFGLILQDSEYLLLILITQFFLGIWQVLSGIVFAIWKKDTWRQRYLGVAILVVLSIIILLNLNPTIRMDNVLGLALLLIIPNIIGFAYFRYSYLQLTKILATPRSFWDLA